MQLQKIHEDIRGIIYSLTGNPLTFEEVSFLYTKKGLARGGCFHAINPEHLTVIQGTIEYYYRLPNTEEIIKVLLNEGQSITIPPKTPHYMISIADSIILEWGCTVEEKQKKHEEFRKIVLDYNERQVQ